MTILDEIIENKKEEVKEAKANVPINELKKIIQNTPYKVKPFINNSNLSLIAEVKKKSPSKGVIRENFDPVKLAQDFAQHNASAVSVLTDQKYFGGSKEFFKQIRNTIEKPLLRKDFVIDKYQVYETRAMQADIILLIVMALKDELKEFLELSLKLGLQVLIEVHNKEELKIALDVLHNLSTAYPQAVLIGINNRNLQTFETNIQTSLDLVDQIPNKYIKISESYLETKDDLELVKQAGFDGVLIGEGLARNPDLLNYWE